MIRRALLPGFIARERRGGDDRDAIGRRRHFGKVDLEIVVGKRRSPERRSPDEVVQPRGAPREEVLTVAQEKVERSFAADFPADRRDGVPEIATSAGIAGKRALQVMQEDAERVLAVGLADRAEAAQGMPPDVSQCAVVGEREVPPPQLADEGMGIGERNFSARSLANVGDGKQRFDGIFANERGQR